MTSDAKYLHLWTYPTMQKTPNWSRNLFQETIEGGPKFFDLVFPRFVALMFLAKNAVLDVMAQVAPHDRVVSIEDTTELQCSVQNHVDLLAVGSVSMLDCLRACMRLKPTRIVVGEVRGAEAHTMLKAWNTGHPGGAATVHANDALSGLIRLESLVAEATSAPQHTLIAEAVDLVVFVDQEPELIAGRKVREVALVTGYREGRYQVEYV